MQKSTKFSMHTQLPYNMTVNPRKEKKNMKLKTITVLLAVLFLAGCATPTDAEREATYKQISVDEAMGMMESESNYIILDVRRADEFAAGHIPGAVNVPNESIGNREITELPDKEQLIFVYCRSGRRSKEASEKLVKLGYTSIVEFGGINDWKGETEN